MFNQDSDQDTESGQRWFATSPPILEPVSIKCWF